ncbi:MAG: hypothetical protein ACI4JC_06090, partial [Faecalibacterium sp.]
VKDEAALPQGSNRERLYFPALLHQRPMARIARIKCSEACPMRIKNFGLCVCTGRLKSFCPAFFKKREKKKVFFGSFFSKKEQNPLVFSTHFLKSVENPKSFL